MRINSCVTQPGPAGGQALRTSRCTPVLEMLFMEKPGTGNEARLRPIMVNEISHES